MLQVHCWLFDRTEDFLDFVEILDPPYMSPQCASYVDLEFSIHAFEHLEVSFNTTSDRCALLLELWMCNRHSKKEVDRSSHSVDSIMLG